MKAKLYFRTFFFLLFIAGVLNSFAQHGMKLNGMVPVIQHQGLTSNSVDVIYDSIYNFTWDTVTASWKNRFKQINFTYNTKNKITSMNGFYWNSTSWKDSTLYSYTFDANDNQVNTLEQLRQNNTWVNSWKYTYEHDSNNNETSLLVQSWENASWINSYRYFSQYDANNNFLSGTAQMWDGTTWIKSDSTFYTYDVNNNWTSILSLGWDGSAWYNVTLQNTTVYNAQHQLMSYTNNLWDSTSWAISNRYTITRDANGNSIHQVEEKLDGVNWMLVSDATALFDANNITTDHFTKFYKVNKLVYSSGVHYYFHTIPSGINDWKGIKESMTVYPNPSTSGIFTIKQTKVNAEIKVYNIVGKQIYSAVIIDPETLIDLSKQAKGIYFIQLISEHKITQAKKLVIE